MSLRGRHQEAGRGLLWTGMEPPPTLAEPPTLQGPASSQGQEQGLAQLLWSPREGAWAGRPSLQAQTALAAGCLWSTGEAKHPGQQAVSYLVFIFDPSAFA